MRMDEWVRGFVLKTQDMGEADVLATWFTKELGKVRGIVVGGRRITSRLLAGVRSGTVIELRLVSRDGHGLYRLAGTRILGAPVKQDDTNKSILLQWFLEVVFRSMPDLQKNEAIFLLAEEVFGELDNIATEDVWSQFLVLVLNNFLATLGVAVHIPAVGVMPKYFSVSGGGFFEVDTQSDRQLVEPGLYLRYLSLKDKNIADGMGERVEHELDRSLLLWLHKFLEYHIDRRIRSFEFLNDILNQ